MPVLPSMETDRKLGRWQMDRWTWMETLLYCYLQACVPAILLLIQNGINRNGSRFQPEAHLSSAWWLLWCTGCPSGDCRLTRSPGPLPLASIRTGLCISLTWEESTNCHMASAEQLCPHSVLELNTPKWALATDRGTDPWQALLQSLAH